MIDKFLSELYQVISHNELPAKDIKFLMEEDDLDKETRYVPLSVITDAIQIIKLNIEKAKVAEQQKEEWHRPYKKFMFVEDGSVDIEQLEEEMEAKHPEIKVVVYRQGANKPEFLDLGE